MPARWISMIRSTRNAPCPDAASLLRRECPLQRREIAGVWDRQARKGPGTHSQCVRRKAVAASPRALRNPEIGRAIAHGNGKRPARPKHAHHFLQCRDRLLEVHEAESADHRIEICVRKRKGFGAAFPPIDALALAAGDCEHVTIGIDAHHLAGGSDTLGRRHREHAECRRQRRARAGQGLSRQPWQHKGPIDETAQGRTNLHKRPRENGRIGP